MHFPKLDDSPMFRKQIQSLEEGTELLRERCLKFYKGCRKYTAYRMQQKGPSPLEQYGAALVLFLLWTLIALDSPFFYAFIPGSVPVWLADVVSVKKKNEDD